MENMYIIFSVPPFHSNIARAILKSPKIYFYDTGQVIGEPGTKLENLVACALLKEIHYREDCFDSNIPKPSVVVAGQIATVDGAAFLKKETPWARH